MRRPRTYPEEQIQRAVVQYLRVALPERLGVMWFAVPGHRGTRKRFEMGILNAMGVRAGIPDLCFVRKDGPPFFIEMKAPKGALSASQKDMIPKLRAAGAETFVCRSLEDVERVLRSQGIEPRGKCA